MDYNDEFAGQGGSYTLDPKTGKRTLAHRTQDPQQTQEAAPEPAAPAETQPASTKARK